MTESKQKKKKLTKDEISDLAELLVDALTTDEDINTARELLIPVPASERIEVYESMRDLCRRKKIKLPPENLVTLLQDYPKIVAKTWPKYFCCIYRTVTGTVDLEQHPDIPYKIFSSALGYYRKPKKGYASLGAKDLGEFILSCPASGAMLLRSLEEALHAEDFSFLETFGTALRALFQEKAGTVKLDSEIVRKMLEQLASVPSSKIFPELFSILPALCLRSQPIPSVFSASGLAEQLRQKKIYPLPNKSSFSASPIPEITRADSLAQLLESVPDFIRSLEQSRKDTKKVNADLKLKLDRKEGKLTTLARELAEMTKKYDCETEQNKKIIKEKSYKISSLDKKVISLQVEKDTWQQEHGRLEEHSAREQEFNQEKLLSDISEKLGGSVENMRGNITRILDGNTLEAKDVQALAAAFNKLCMTFNLFSKIMVERIPNESIASFSVE